ncbi:toll/interleukin-1 receptor domain-containing protein [Sorangium sp. So ce296]|uniref:toll/interleukin-1 receptor domain-containing protein n=1 Tax=Sorangium sp. So ce296 TaxID=3133296 RepID=UPI003F601B0C
MFISYCYDDVKWLARLKKMLRPLTRERAISVWDTTQIGPGHKKKWRQEIDAAIDSACVAVLLISSNFLDSDLIVNGELRRILDSASRQGLTVLWICVGSCLHEETPLCHYWAANNPEKPFDSYRGAQRDAELAKIARLIAKAARSSDEEHGSVPLVPHTTKIVALPAQTNSETSADGYAAHATIVEEIESVSLWNQVDMAIKRRLKLRGKILNQTPTALELNRCGILDEGGAALYEKALLSCRDLSRFPASGAPSGISQGDTTLLRQLLAAAGDLNYIEQLCDMSDEQVVDTVYDEISDKSYGLIDSESFCDAMADTNATDWEIDEIVIDDVNIEVERERCVVHFRFFASGQQLDEKMYCGTRICGSADAIVSADGDVEYENVDASIEYYGDDYDPHE